MIKSLNRKTKFSSYYYGRPYYKNHPFHIVYPSLWPFFISVALYFFTHHLVLSFSDFKSEYSSLLFYFLSLLLFIILWVRDLIKESNNPYIHTYAVERNILLGMLLFIMSEVMLFFGFFWAFFNFSLSPSIFIGHIWPPKNIITLNPWKLPFLNTVILLVSGITVNWYYFSLKNLKYHFKSFKIISEISANWYVKVNKDILFLESFILIDSIKVFGPLSYVKLNFKKIQRLVTILSFYNLEFHKNLLLFCFPKYRYFYFINYQRLNIKRSLIITILLGILFLFFQLYEYSHATFYLSSVYGTVFYLTTGLHGLHVFLGVTLLSIQAWLLFYKQYFDKAAKPHVGVTCAVWYWHFVDVVWLFLFCFVYVWGS